MNLLLSDARQLSLLDIEGCVRGKLKGKEHELFRSIQGFFSGHHRFILKRLLNTVAMLEEEVAGFNRQIQQMMEDQKDLLDRMKKAAGIADSE